MREIEAMPEYHLFSQIRDLGMSEFTLLGNYADLEAAIKSLCDPEAPPQIFHLRNRDRQEAVMYHIARHLHNFVAASSSLIEHTRRLYRKLNEGKGTGKRPFSEYQVEVNRVFRDDPLAQFVNGLRNYCQHYRMPAIVLATTNTGPQNTLQRTIMLHKPHLLEFDRWEPPARRYLDTMPDRVELLAVAGAYRDKVEKFHTWFGDRERAIFAEEIGRFKEKERQRVLMTIEDDIDARMVNVSPLSKEECFVSMFDSRDYAELHQTLADSRERADKVIELLEREVLLPDKVKDKIIVMFQPSPQAESGG